MSSRCLALFSRLEEQSFNSTHELDSPGAVLSKTGPAPVGWLESGVPFHPGSVLVGSLGV